MFLNKFFLEPTHLECSWVLWSLQCSSFPETASTRTLKTNRSATPQWRLFIRTSRRYGRSKRYGRARLHGASAESVNVERATPTFALLLLKFAVKRTSGEQKARARWQRLPVRECQQIKSRCWTPTVENDKVQPECLRYEERFTHS